MSDYSEHLISMAGGDVLDAIAERYEVSQAALSHGSSSNMRMLHRLSESANDIPALLAMVRELELRVTKAWKEGYQEGSADEVAHTNYLSEQDAS